MAIKLQQIEQGQNLKGISQASIPVSVSIIFALLMLLIIAAMVVLFWLHVA